MHSPYRWLHFCISVLILSVVGITSSGIAAAQMTAGFSPVPIWPADGNVPVALADRYVFYAPATEEIVLAVPENFLKEPDEFGKLPAGPPGPRKVYRINTTRGSRPTLDMTVGRLPDGRYQYTYRLSNGANALRAITSWQLYTNWIVDTGAVAAPNQWKGSFSPTQVSLGAKPATGPIGAFTLNTGMFVDWFYNDDKATIAPGSAQTDFRLTAPLKPGFTFAFVRAGDTGSAPEGLPQIVRAQLVPVLSPSFNSQSVVTIGPKFSPEVSRATIAQDYYLGIQRLIGTRQLVENSPAIQEALQVLERYRERPDLFDNSPLNLRVPPAGPLESSILDAMKLSMQ